MPVFDTTEPISVTLELISARVTLDAAAHPHTEVEIAPADGSAASARAAAETTVEFNRGSLVIRTPRQRGSLFGRGRQSTVDGSITVGIRLAPGSSVRGEAGLGRLHAEGRLGECRFKTASGDIRLQETGPLRLETALGAIAVGRVDGAAEVNNVSGPTEIGEVTGGLRVVGANGEVRVGRAAGDAEVKIANGGVTIGEVSAGTVQLETTVGSVDVGIREGVAALLDLRSLIGGVSNNLEGSAAPASGEKSVRVHARSLNGDIRVHRASQR